MTKRVCPICNEPHSALWTHKRNKHPEIDDKEYLARYLKLPKVPECQSPDCNNLVNIDYGHYRFTKHCSIACANHVKWSNPEYSKKVANMGRNYLNRRRQDPILSKEDSERSSRIMTRVNNELWSRPGRREYMSKIASETITRLWTEDWFREMKTNELKIRWEDPKFREKMRPIQSENGKRVAAYNLQRIAQLPLGERKSEVELRTYQRVLLLFPNLTIKSNSKIGRYYPDIVIDELKLIIEVDGYQYHDIDRDINRDRTLYDKGYKVKRLDSELCDYITDDEFRFMVLNESIQSTPYWERIPYEQLMLWKWNIYQTGPMRLLTYNKEDK